MSEADRLQDINENDVFKILVATDIHLGYDEKDPIKGQDTFDTFEEILQIAEDEQVDFILLGGDLFHHAKPSPYCIFKCTELLKRYCLGDKPVEVEFLSDANTSFSTHTVNYEDPNLNVSIPVFSIHGNHDDPSGQQLISAVDLLATSGLINYFGKCKSYDHVEIDPIFMRKGESKLALYGLSHIKDERLGRLFLDKKVTFKFHIDDEPASQDNWFRLLVWHQNRAARGAKNFIPEETLPEMLNLVIWGHEHDCRILPEKFAQVYISQPGSSVATSLCDGESIPKNVGLLTIYKNNFKMYPIELKTVRPFIYSDVLLKTIDEMDADACIEENIRTKEESSRYSKMAMATVKRKVKEMIAEAKSLGRTPRVADKPLIRINVRCSDEQQMFNTIRFGQDYMDEVANPDDMVKCFLLKDRSRKKKGWASHRDDEPLAARVEDLVTQMFAENDTLKLFTVSGMNEAVKKFIDAYDTDAVSDVTELYRKETLKKLEEDMPEIEDLDQVIENMKAQKEKEVLENIARLLNDPSRQRSDKSPDKSQDKGRSAQRNSSRDEDDEPITIEDDDDEPVAGASSRSVTSRPTKGPGSRGGRGSRSRKGKGRVK